jgi:hypothetical protein
MQVSHISWIGLCVIIALVLVLDLSHAVAAVSVKVVSFLSVSVLDRVTIDRWLRESVIPMLMFFSNLKPSGIFCARSRNLKYVFVRI